MLTSAMHSVAESIRAITSEISEIADRNGRSADSIELMAVSKTRTRAEIDMAIAAGVTLFGENRVAEALEKFDPIRDSFRLNMIGHLQRNKAREAAQFFDEIESIDKVSTVDALLRVRGESDHPLGILIEINTSGEATKSGVSGRDNLYRLIDEILERQGVAINGFMTIAPFVTDELVVRGAFAKLREELERARSAFDLASATTLSMGMTSDYRWAIVEGSTRVRIGTAIFGRREAV